MEHLDMRKKVIIMIAVMSAMLFSALNMTIVGTALPKIVAEIGGMEYFNWVFTIYMLTASITSILVGKLSDIYGRKPFILAGICIFMFGGILSGFSSTIIQLIVFRGIQGLGGGLIMSTAMTTIGDLFSPRERGKWQGMMGGVFGLSSLFGPTLGGFIVDNMDWSWVFWIFLPLGLFAFVMILKLYPKVEQQEKETIDYLGSFVLSIVILTLLLAFSWAGKEYAWNSFVIISLFSASFILLLLFIYIENKVKSPVVPLHLFKNSVVSISNIVSFLSGMGMFGMIMYIPFYVQGVMGRSATASGLFEMVMTVSMVGFSAVAGQIITRTGKYKLLGLAGFIVMATGHYLNSNLTPETSSTTLIFNLIISGIGLGLTMPIFTLTVQNAVDHKYLGVATATSQFFRQMGGTIGVAILGYIMSSKMSKKMAEAKLPSLPPGSEELGQIQGPEALMDPHIMDTFKTKIPEQMQPLFEQFLMTLKEALNSALTEVFFFSSMIIATAFVMTLFLKEIPLRTSNQKNTAQKEKEIV